MWADVDKLNIPTLDSVRAVMVENGANLVTRLERALTETEISALESMHSEHASYALKLVR